MLLLPLPRGAFPDALCGRQDTAHLTRARRGSVPAARTGKYSTASGFLTVRRLSPDGRSYVDTAAFFAVSGDQIEAEAIYFQTRRLPAGLQAKGGKFWWPFFC